MINILLEIVVVVVVELAVVIVVKVLVACHILSSDGQHIAGNSSSIVSSGSRCRILNILYFFTRWSTYCWRKSVPQRKEVGRQGRELPMSASVKDSVNWVVPHTWQVGFCYCYRVFVCGLGSESVCVCVLGEGGGLSGSVCLGLRVCVFGSESVF